MREDFFSSLVHSYSLLSCCGLCPPSHHHQILLPNCPLCVVAIVLSRSSSSVFACATLFAVSIWLSLSSYPLFPFRVIRFRFILSKFFGDLHFLIAHPSFSLLKHYSIARYLSILLVSYILSAIVEMFDSAFVPSLSIVHGLRAYCLCPVKRVSNNSVRKIFYSVLTFLFPSAVRRDRDSFLELATDS